MIALQLYHIYTYVIDPHLLVSQEDILQEVHNDIVDDAVPQDQPKIIDRPSTIFVEQKGIYTKAIATLQ